MMKNEVVYQMTSNYRDNISKVLNQYEHDNNFRSKQHMLDTFNAKMKTNVAYSTWNDWVRGNVVPSVQYCALLAKFMNIDIYDLLYSKEG